MEVFSKYFPDFNMSTKLVLRVFGCVSFVHVHSHSRSKLDPRAVKCVFIGYSPTQKGYKCHNPITHKTYVFADVTFAEHESYFSSLYPQGEASSMEDKDLFLKEPSMVVKISPVQIELNSKNVQTELTSEKELISKPCEPILEVEKPSKPINPTLTKPL